MPLTITVAQLSEAVRLTISGSPPPPYLGILTRQLAVAESIIEDYANVDCPDDVKNEAAIMFVAYRLAEEERRQQSRDPFANSGAKALLARWHDLVSSKVDIY